jgi:hypothetical protein
MPRNSTGKWVARAAATGGGRTYRGQRPVNWYAGLIVLVVLGLLSVVYARYEYQHPHHVAAVQPTVGTKWFAGISFDDCGQTVGPLTASTDATTLGMTTSGGGIISIAPLTKAQAGKNATFGQFVANYPGLAVTTKSFQYPGNKLLTNGEKCPSGTPDAGKVGHVAVAYWQNTDPETKRVKVADPTTLKIGSSSLISVGFLPAGKTPPRPAQSIVTAVLEAASGSTTTTTTAPTAVTTPSTTATTTASTPSTTAAKSSSTTTATTAPATP